MALKIIDHNSAEYMQMVQLRDALLRKPLGLRFSKEELEAEKNNMLIAAFDDDEILGCCMLVTHTPAMVQLRQMAVLNNLQGKGIGRSLINFAENVARDKGYKTIMMHARENAVGFYQRVGYAVKGEPFTEITIVHYIMQKDL